VGCVELFVVCCCAAGPSDDHSVSECRENGHVTVSRDAGYMSSAMRPVDCGWSVRGRRGQRIKLTLAAFGGDGRPTSGPAETLAEVSRVIAGGQSSTCHEVGSVSDGEQRPATRRPLVICGPGHTDRRPSQHILLFMSESHHVIVTLKPASSLQHISPFLIKYEGLLTYLFA